ncbi:MAG: S1C family serine protease [Bryobacteraceae bacterium]
MANELAALSNELAAAVERAGKSVVAVHARPRFSSSGVFWKPGVIVTAEHSIRREEDIRVTLPDGKSAVATLLGSDAGSDLAVLKVDAEGVPVTGAREAPEPGNLALTIGRSEDSGVNATMGIISAIGPAWRTWRGGRLDSYIRLDLTLYPGSTGGLVVNVAGEAVGIATPALSRIAGVAIPAPNVNRAVEEILKRGRVARGYLGVGLQPVEISEHHKGLIVLSIEPGGPAAKAGILIGDILVSLGGKSVEDTEDIQAALEGHAVGTAIETVVSRGGEERGISVTIGERPVRS